MQKHEVVGLAVGEKYPFSLPPQDGGVVLFSQSGLTLLVRLGSPSSNEVASFQGVPPKRIGVVKAGRLGALVLKFGSAITLDCPFDAGLEASSSIPDLTFENEKSRMLVTTILVDGDSMKICSLGAVSLSPHVSRCVAKLIQEQVASPTDFQAHQARIDELYARYPSADALIRAAIAFDKAGEDVAPPSAH